MFVAFVFVLQPELQVDMEPALRSPFKLSADFCQGWLLFSLMLLTAQPLCALPLPVCVKLKVSVCNSSLYSGAAEGEVQ